MTYYFGIPSDYAHDMHGTTHMLAFERYGSRDVYESRYLPRECLTGAGLVQWTSQVSRNGQVPYKGSGGHDDQARPHAL